MTTNPENNNVPPQNQPYGQQPPVNGAPQNGQVPNGNFNTQNGYPVAPEVSYNQQPGFSPNPQALADAKQSKTFGIIAIVLSAISLLIFGFLSIVGIGLSIRGLSQAKKAATAGVPGPGKTLNIVGLIIGIIAFILWILALVLMATN